MFKVIVLDSRKYKPSHVFLCALIRVLKIIHNPSMHLRNGYDIILVFGWKNGGEASRLLEERKGESVGTRAALQLVYVEMFRD